jgi:hypothetical protein
MRRIAVAVALMGLTTVAAPAAGEDVIVVQETRTPDKARKSVQHSAVLRNAGSRTVHHLRVTIELYDHFGALLWARTVSPSPTSLRPGDTATLSLTTPHLPEHRRTAYRFDSRAP